MAAAQVVGDPACSLSSKGPPSPSLIPAGVTSISTGTAGGYYCYIW